MTSRIPAKKSCSSHLLGVVPSRATQTAFVPELSKAITFFVLRPILVKFPIPTRLIKSFPLSILEVLPRKVALYNSSHLTPIEAWQSAVSTTSEGCRVSNKARLENCTQVWGWAKFGQRATHGWGEITLHTCSDLSKLVRTCPNQSAIQWPCTPVAQCTFECSYYSVLRPILVTLPILTRLVEIFPMVYELWYNRDTQTHRCTDGEKKG